MEKSILHDEHVLLGAQLGEGSDGRHAPLSYQNTDEQAAFEQGAALIDLTGLGARLLTGENAPQLASAIFAGEPLEIGQVRTQVALTGDGTIASLALVARTGTQEFAWWDLAGRGDILTAWVGFVAGIQQQGVRPFEGCELEDAAEALVPLLLWGPQATAVLSDYLGHQEPPQPGSMANLNLDRIGCLVGAPQLDHQPSYLVLVPPAYARVLWRSFLSFPVVSPVGIDALVQRVCHRFPFVNPEASQDGKLVVSAATLRNAGLLRADGSFIGYRGLASA